MMFPNIIGGKTEGLNELAFLAPTCSNSPIEPVAPAGNCCQSPKCFAENSELHSLKRQRKTQASKVNLNLES